ncbi:MAG: hypothetical protein JXA52_09405, partial [Planctomycetes bacterium]|nr:hypothetical protein [Planctomycetota bacterium]
MASAPKEEDPGITIPLRGATTTDETPTGNVMVIDTEQNWNQFQIWISDALTSAYGDNAFVKEVMIPQALLLGKMFGPEIADEILNNIMDRYMGEDGDPADFLAEMLEKIADGAIDSQQPNAEMQRKILHANMLQRVIADSRFSEAWGLSDTSRGYLQDHLDYVIGELKPMLAAQMGITKKSGDLMKELEATTGYTSLFALTREIGEDLLPGINRMKNILSRLSESTDLSPEERIDATVRATASLEALAQRVGSMTPEVRNEVFGTLAQSLEMFAKQAREFAQQDKFRDTPAAKEFVKQADLADLQRARALLGSGKFEEALHAADYVQSGEIDVLRERSLTWLQIASEIGSKLDKLSPEQKKEFTPEKLADIATNARFKLLSIASNPTEAAMVGVDLIRGIEAAGNLDWAIRNLQEEVMPRAGDDPVLQGLRLHLQIKRQNGLTDPETIGKLLGEIPEKLQSEALSGAISFLGADTSPEALNAYEKVITGTDRISPEQKNGMMLKLELARLQLLTGKLPSYTRDDAIGKQLETIRARLAGLDEGLVSSVEQALQGIEENLDKPNTWRKLLDRGQMPEGGYSNLAREAFSAGRFDIAGEALARQMQHAYEDLQFDTAPQEFMEIATLIEMVNRRMQDPSLSQEQRESATVFFDKVKGAADQYLDRFLTELKGSYSKGVYGVAEKGLTEGPRVEELDRKLTDIRTLTRMRAQMEIAGMSKEDAQQALGKMQVAARERVNKTIKAIEDRYAEAGEDVHSGQMNVDVKARLADLEVLRAARDGLSDLWMKKFAIAQSINNLDRVEGEGSILPNTTVLNGALRDIESQLNGVAPLGTSIHISPSERQSHYDDSWKRGARNRLLYRQSALANVGDPKDMPIKALLAQNEVQYLERRRMQLIFEDPSLTKEQKEELLLALFKHEAGLWEKLGKDVSPLLMPELTDIGKPDLDRAQARYAYAEQTRIGFSKADFESYRENDPQKAFMALVKVREANLAGEIDLYVKHLDDSFWTRGPVKGIGVGLYSEDVSEKLNRYSADQMQLHPVLIRAASHPLEELSEKDRQILTERGFIVDDKYAIPKGIRLEHITTASDFVDATTSKIDEYVNIRQGLELAATVAIPGGISARMAGGTLARYSMAQLLRKEGAALTLKTAGKFLATKDGAKWAAAWVGERFIEGALFTGMSRVATTAIHPVEMMNPERWSLSALGKEYLHTVGVLGVLRGVGAGNQMAKGRLG